MARHFKTCDFRCDCRNTRRKPNRQAGKLNSHTEVLRISHTSFRAYIAGKQSRILQVLSAMDA